jgi:hypothetical protein
MELKKLYDRLGNCYDSAVATKAHLLLRDRSFAEDAGSANPATPESTPDTHADNDEDNLQRISQPDLANWDSYWVKGSPHNARYTLDSNGKPIEVMTGDLVDDSDEARARAVDLAVQRVNENYPERLEGNIKKYLSYDTAKEMRKQRTPKPKGQATAKTGVAAVKIAKGTGSLLKRGYQQLKKLQQKVSAS